jgi:hypothetical protein
MIPSGGKTAVSRFPQLGTVRFSYATSRRRSNLQDRHDPARLPHPVRRNSLSVRLPNGNTVVARLRIGTGVGSATSAERRSARKCAEGPGEAINRGCFRIRHRSSWGADRLTRAAGCQRAGSTSRYGSRSRDPRLSMPRAAVRPPRLNHRLRVAISTASAIISERARRGSRHGHPHWTETRAAGDTDALLLTHIGLVLHGPHRCRASRPSRRAAVLVDRRAAAIYQLAHRGTRPRGRDSIFGSSLGPYCPRRAGTRREGPLGRSCNCRRGEVR